MKRHRHLKASMFFRAIESMTASSLNYLDTTIPRLEAEYGPANEINMNGFSLCGAVINNATLSSFNKIQLIAWLRRHGVTATPADIAAAKETRDQNIINAVITK